MRLALIAKDIHRSVLTATFEAFSKDVGLECNFEVCNISEDKLPAKVERSRSVYDGYVVTMPYKRTIMKYLDELDISARECGSCNVVKVENGKLRGYNTDGWGFVKALQLKGKSVRGLRAVMVGAGGVAMSLAYHLREAGIAHVDVINAFPNETQELCSTFGELFKGHPLNDEILNECAKGAQLFLNASILGQVGYPEYENLSFLKNLDPNAIVFDVNYSKADANLPRAAREMGYVSYVGRCMSACQGILAMEIWTGRRPSDACASELVARLEENTL